MPSARIGVMKKGWCGVVVSGWKCKFVWGGEYMGLCIDCSSYVGRFWGMPFCSWELGFALYDTLIYARYCFYVV